MILQVIFIKKKIVFCVFLAAMLVLLGYAASIAGSTSYERGYIFGYWKSKCLTYGAIAYVIWRWGAKKKEYRLLCFSIGFTFAAYGPIIATFSSLPKIKAEREFQAYEQCSRDITLFKGRRNKTPLSDVYESLLNHQEETSAFFKQEMIELGKAFNKADVENIFSTISDRNKMCEARNALQVLYRFLEETEERLNTKCNEWKQFSVVSDDPKIRGSIAGRHAGIHSTCLYFTDVYQNKREYIMAMDSMLSFLSEIIGAYDLTEEGPIFANAHDFFTYNAHIQKIRELELRGKKLAMAGVEKSKRAFEILDIPEEEVEAFEDKLKSQLVVD